MNITGIRPIIFLDVDGVFNCQLFYDEYYSHLTRFDGIPFYKTVKKYLRKLYGVRGKIRDSDIINLDYYKSEICPKRIGWFNELCEEVDAVVVLSASMRSGKTIKQLQEIFNYCGATFTIIDKTDYCECETRGCEIEKWLHENIKPEVYGCNYFDFYNYVIIDDDSDMLLNQQHHFFHTDTYSGLTPSTCYKIKRFLTHETFKHKTNEENPIITENS
jgi:hypothetical protein